MNKEMKEYRAHLVTAQQEAQEDYDKTVLALSGGALGVSFAFVKDIVGPTSVFSPLYLQIAWASWALSVACVLASYYFSHSALRTAISQVDANNIRTSHPGGLSDRATAALNIADGLLFILGVISIMQFAVLSMGGQNA